MNILQAMDDPRIFGPFFRGPSWAFWRTVLAVLFNLPLSTEEKATAIKHTGRTRLFDGPLHELWLGIGRRGGKSRVCALIAVFIACFVDHSTHLVPGEVGIVLLCAPSQRQARVLLGYIVAFLHATPILSRMIVRETEFSVELSNNINIEVRSSNFKTIRGFTVVAAICDELAFLPSDDSAIPDSELLAALRPSMSTIPSALLICSSTLHARTGELFQAHAKHFANDESDVAFFNASTLVANPALDARVVELAFEQDEAVARAEYGCEGFVFFRSDVATFISPEVLEMSVDRDRPLILPPMIEVAA